MVAVVLPIPTRADAGPKGPEPPNLVGRAVYTGYESPLRKSKHESPPSSAASFMSWPQPSPLISGYESPPRKSKEERLRAIYGPDEEPWAPSPAHSSVAVVSWHEASRLISAFDSRTERMRFIHESDAGPWEPEPPTPDGTVVSTGYESPSKEERFGGRDGEPWAACPPSSAASPMSWPQPSPLISGCESPPRKSKEERLRAIYGPDGEPWAPSPAHSSVAVVSWHEASRLISALDSRTERMRFIYGLDAESWAPETSSPACSVCSGCETPPLKPSEKEMQEMDVEEKDAQSEYEQLMRDLANAEKGDAKVDTEAALQKASTERKSTVNEAMAKAEEIL